MNIEMWTIYSQEPKHDHINFSYQRSRELNRQKNVNSLVISNLEKSSILVSQRKIAQAKQEIA